jgi:hypothetical protein
MAWIFLFYENGGKIMTKCKECDKELTPDEIIACGKCGNEYCSTCGEAYKTLCEDTTCGNVVRRDG